MQLKLVLSDKQRLSLELSTPHKGLCSHEGTADLSLHEKNLPKLPLPHLTQVDQTRPGKLPLAGVAVGSGAIIPDEIMHWSRVLKLRREKHAALEHSLTEVDPNREQRQGGSWG